MKIVSPHGSQKAHFAHGLNILFIIQTFAIDSRKMPEALQYHSLHLTGPLVMTVVNVFVERQVVCDILISTAFYTIRGGHVTTGMTYWDTYLSFSTFSI